MQRKTDWHFSGKSWVFIDLILAFSAMLCAYGWAPEMPVSWVSPFPTQPAAYQTAIAFAVLVGFGGNILGIHDPLRPRNYLPMMIRVLVAILGSLMLMTLWLYFAGLQELGRTIFVAAMIFCFVFLSLSRMLLWQMGHRFRRRLLVLTNEKEATYITNSIDFSQLPFRVFREKDLARKELLRFCRKYEIDEVVIAPNQMEEVGTDQWVECIQEGVQVTSLNSFLERHFYKVRIDGVGRNWLLELDLKLTHPIYHRWKRLMDIACALLGLVITFPFVIALVVAIYFDTGRPFFYKQKRVGLRGNLFTIWKLRTMRVHKTEGNSKWAKKDDPRVTKLGYLLRRTRFDEVPQFWNILKGDMSFIGPRPEWDDIAAHWTKEISLYPYRNLLKPGLTGWAQINYAYAESKEDVLEKLSYDFYYMKHASVLLDLQIILRTVGAIMKGSR